MSFIHTTPKKKEDKSKQPFHEPLINENLYTPSPVKSKGRNQLFVNYSDNPVKRVYGKESPKDKEMGELDWEHELQIPRMSVVSKKYFPYNRNVKLPFRQRKYKIPDVGILELSYGKYLKKVETTSSRLVKNPYGVFIMSMRFAPDLENFEKNDKFRTIQITTTTNTFDNSLWFGQEQYAPSPTHQKGFGVDKSRKRIWVQNAFKPKLQIPYIVHDGCGWNFDVKVSEQGKSPYYGKVHYGGLTEWDLEINYQILLQDNRLHQLSYDAPTIRPPCEPTLVLLSKKDAKYSKLFWDKKHKDKISKNEYGYLEAIREKQLMATWKIRFQTFIIHTKKDGTEKILGRIEWGFDTRNKSMSFKKMAYNVVTDVRFFDSSEITKPFQLLIDAWNKRYGLHYLGKTGDNNSSKTLPPKLSSIKIKEELEQKNDEILENLFDENFN